MGKKNLEQLSDTNIFYNKQHTAENMPECRLKFLHDLDIYRTDRKERYGTADLIAHIFDVHKRHNAGYAYRYNEYFLKNDGWIYETILEKPTIEEITNRSSMIYELTQDKTLFDEFRKIYEKTFAMMQKTEDISRKYKEPNEYDRCLEEGFSLMQEFVDLAGMSRKINSKSNPGKRLKKILSELEDSEPYKMARFVLHSAHSGLEINVKMLEPDPFSGQQKWDMKARFKNFKDTQESQLSTYNLVRFGENIYNAFMKGMIHVIESHVSRQLSDLGRNVEKYVAFARFYKEFQDKGFDVCIPDMKPKERQYHTMIDVKNPWLVRSTDAKDIIGNDLLLNKSRRIMIIDGPNNGGKTVYLKTIGVNEALAQCGLPIFAKSAKISIIEDIFTHFEEREDILKKEGRLANGVKRFKQIFESGNRYSMILSDEPYTGTAHLDALEHTKNLIQGADMLGAHMVVSSHLHELARIKDVNSVKRMHVGFVSEGDRIRPTYRLEKGRAGKSYSETVLMKEKFTFDDMKEIIKKKNNP